MSQTPCASVCGRLVVHVQQFGRFLLERERATGAGADDGEPGAGKARQRGDVAPVIACGGVEFAVAQQRQPTAILRRDDDLVAVVLQDGDRGFAHKRLIVERGAAVEVDDLFLAAQPVRGDAAQPVAEGAAFAPAGQRRLAGDAHDSFGQIAADGIVQRQIGEGGHDAADLCHEVVAAQQPVAERDAPVGDDLRTGAGV